MAVLSQCTLNGTCHGDGRLTDSHHMAGTLDILVVDDRPESVLFLTEFLMQRCRRVDVASSVKEAVTAITRRKNAGETYHLIFSDFVMPGADGLSLLRELRMRGDQIPFAFITGYRTLNPSLESESKKLGVVAILDKPIELREVERLLESTTSTFRRQKEAAAGEQPFFGTSRTMRRPTGPPSLPPTEPSRALEPRQASPASDPASPPEPLSMPTTAAWQAPAAALEPRVPAGLQPQPAAPPPPEPAAIPIQPYQRRPSAIVAVGSTTARLRRGVSPGAAPPNPGTGRISGFHTPQPVTSFTARVRRGVEGTGSIRNPNHTESGRMVACAACGKSFMVMSKPEAFNMLCVHCGQMQRIEPA